MTQPCGHTLGLALILFALLMALGELLMRTPAFRTHVVPVAGGGVHEQFPVQLGRLGTVVARDGPIDCMFLGNSMVWFGLDPEAFARAYRRQTGQDIRCFNFGIAAMPTVSAGAVAPVLVDDYRPSLLIYGTTARDYALGKGSEQATALTEMPWLRYRLGQFSIQGWLCEHSRLYQYWDTLGHLLRLENRYLLLTGWYASAKWNYGFEPHEAVGTFVSMPPDSQSDDEKVRGLFERLSGYEMLPENLVGLEQVVAQNGPGLQVLVVEMPVPPTYLHFFGNGQQDHQRFIDTVENISASRGVPFWQTTQLQLIPDDGWLDYSHMNSAGARVFSEWLGQRVGEAMKRGIIRDVAPHGE